MEQEQGIRVFRAGPELPLGGCGHGACGLLEAVMGGASFLYLSGFWSTQWGGRLGLPGFFGAPGPLAGFSSCPRERRWRGAGVLVWGLAAEAGGSAAHPPAYPQGLFDNFLRLRLRDSSLGTVCTALDWLAFDDLLSRAAHHGQSFQLLRYLPFLPAAFHLLFASSHVPRIAFPSSQQEVCPLHPARACGLAQGS